ncbi:MAG TPA: TonB-dependent receptor [Gemmatimonadaceae bacterium]|nr:TonB-dependent receptor [Gemmatimonadaceae bacterium]
MWALPAVPAALIVAAATLCAQQRDTATIPPTTLPPVVVTVTRDAARSPLDLPFAISAVHPDSARPGQRHLSLDETLFEVPGVTVANRHNPTQDPRISIRGFGARSAFGVRGVRMIRDGIPLTLPDGQTPVDYLDLASVGRVEVIRGSAAALYGNASGGVIDLQSSAPPPVPLSLRVQTWADSGGVSRWLGAFSGRTAALTYQGDISHDVTDGFRAHSEERATSGFGRITTSFGHTLLALDLMGYDKPLSQNPGALTAAELKSDRTMAAPAYVAKEAGKTARQGVIGLTATHTAGERQFTAMIFGGGRSLDNPLTFGIINLGRTSYGASLRGTMPLHLFGMTHRVSAGIDMQQQNDNRQNFENCNALPPGTAPTAACPVAGHSRGATTLDQREQISGGGVYVRDELALAPGYFLSAGVRADYVHFDVTDHLITPTNPDDSGDRTLHAISPMAGVVARVTPLTSLYANVASAFETPTATELANRPDGSGGINPTLQPQRSTTYEVGLKGITLGRVQYDLALFTTGVRDELIPYQVPGGNDRVFYRNAGRTDRRGAELGVNLFFDEFRAGLTYSYSHFHFTRFATDSADYAGNRIPGIPVQQTQASVTWRHSDVFATVEAQARGRVYADDANDVSVAGYQTVNLRFGGTAMFGDTMLSPEVGVRNLFGEQYIGSISVNAALGKYYEPAPGRVIFAGLGIAVGH